MIGACKRSGSSLGKAERPHALHQDLCCCDLCGRAAAPPATGPPLAQLGHGLVERRRANGNLAGVSGTGWVFSRF